MSQYRTEFKDAVSAGINDAYGLSARSKDFKAQVDALLEDRRYIYPGEPGKVSLPFLSVDEVLLPLQDPVVKAHIFLNDAIVWLIRDLVFDKFIYLFTRFSRSFETEYKGETVAIVPTPLVSFIATAVSHFCVSFTNC